MIQHLWTIVCSRGLVDAETHNISLINVLEEVTVPASTLEGKAKMSLPMPFEVVSCWMRRRRQQAARGKGRLTLLDPAGKSIEQESFEIDLREHPRSRIRVRVPGLEIDGSGGTYLFRVEVQQEGLHSWQEVTQVPLEVHIR